MTNVYGPLEEAIVADAEAGYKVSYNDIDHRVAMSGQQIFKFFWAMKGVGPDLSFSSTPDALTVI